jgi:hypothetical protein
MSLLLKEGGEEDYSDAADAEFPDEFAALDYAARLRLLVAVGVGKFQDLAVDTGVGESSVGVGEMVDAVLGGDGAQVVRGGAVRSGG